MRRTILTARPDDKRLYRGVVRGGGGGGGGGGRKGGKSKNAHRGENQSRLVKR